MMSIEQRGRIRKILQSKTIGEALDNTTYGMIETLALLPAFIFLSVYIYGYRMNFIPTEFNTVISPEPFNSFFRDTCISAIAIGFFAVILHAAKKRRDGRAENFRSFLKDNMYLVFFAIFYLLMLLTSAVHGFPYAFEGHYYRGESMFTIICYFAAFMLPLTIVRSPKRRKAVIYSFMVFGIIMGVSMLVKYYYFGIVENRFVGIYSQFNHYAYFLTIIISASAVLMLYEKNLTLRILSAVNFVFSVVLLVINDTFGAWLSTFAAMILIPVMISLKNRRFTPKALLPLLVYVVLVPSTIFMMMGGDMENFTTFGDDLMNILSGDITGAEGTGRLALWEFAADKIKEEPLLGQGLEGVSQEMENTVGNDRCHNEYLQYALAFGIPAAVAYTLGCLFVFLRGLRLKADLDSTQIAAFAAAFAYLVSAFAGNSMYYTAPLLFIFMGLACSVCSDTE